MGARFVQLYEALETHNCWLCDREIQPGEFFTRGGVHGQSPSIPVCTDCRPAMPWVGERPANDPLWTRR